MAGIIGIQHVYLTLTKRHASQLLWRVEPLFKDGKFPYLSTRPLKYRAPSFSWASVDSETGKTYREPTDQGLLISVEDFEVTSVTAPFDLLRGGYLLVAGALAGIRITKTTVKESTQYSWHLLISQGSKYYKGCTNVYMDDCSEDPNILANGRQTYFLPAAYQAADLQKTSEQYLMCVLLLQVTGPDELPGTYKRIGISKVPNGWKTKRLFLSS